MSIFVKWFMGIIIVLMVCYFLSVAILLLKGAKLVSEADWSHGLSGVVDKVWCGEKGCQKP